MLKDGVLVLRGVLDPSLCTSLMRTYEEYRPYGSQRDYNGNKVVHLCDLVNDGPARRAIGKIAAMSRALVREWYREHHDVESVFLARLSEGQVMEPHYDNTRLDGKIPNHTPQRSHSSLFYLNGDFDGGEIVLPRQGLLLKPETGMYVSFPAYPPYLHHVTPVRGGMRYSMPVWFTQRSDAKLTAKEVFCAQDGQ